MGFQFNQLVGKPQARLAVEAGAQKGRERQEELNLERNKQAMTMRQLMLEQQKLKASTDISMRDLALREKESKIAADLNELQKVKMSLDIANYETPAQKRTAELKTLKAESQIKTEEAVRGKKLAYEFESSTPEYKIALDEARAKAYQEIKKAETDKPLTASDINDYYKTLSDYTTAISVARDEGDKKAVAEYESLRNAYIQSFSPKIEGKGNASVGTFEEYQKSTQAPAQITSVPSAKNLPVREQEAVAKVKTIEEAKKMFPDSSPQMQRALAQKVAIFQNYLETAKAELDVAKKRYATVSALAGNKTHPDVIAANKAIKAAEEKLRQILQSGLDTVDGLQRKEAGILPIEQLARQQEEQIRAQDSAWNIVPGK